MGKIVVSGLLLLGLLVGVRAWMHARMSKEDKAQHITEKMTRRLGLTEEHRNQVYALNLGRIEGHQAAYEAGRKKELLLQAIEQWKSGLKQTLTPEQAQKMGI